jgi:hypothetical protein
VIYRVKLSYLNSSEKSRILVVLLFSLFTFSALAQDSLRVSGVDSTQVGSPKTFSEKWNMKPHSPMKATVFSAVIPGTGQMYNKKWWKSAIVYAGMGTCVYFIVDNNKNYHTFLDAYVASVDGDVNTTPQIEGNSAYFNEWQEQYHRWRDVSYMALVGVYVLQIIDANVDGHLFYYDVSPEMNLSFHPYVIPSAQLNAGFGLQLRF